MTRYQVVLDIAESIRPRVIAEIGTYQGSTALGLIEVAKKYHKRPIYWGFDAFDAVPAYELPYRDFPSYDLVRARLEETDAEIHLVRGNTRESLKTVEIKHLDLVFIDGGHSLETIENDWKWVESQLNDNTVVVFDDYYVGDNTKGCKKLVEGLKDYNVEIIQPGVTFPQYIVHFVKLWKK